MNDEMVAGLNQIAEALENRQGVQVRSESTGIRNFGTLREAMDAARDDTTIWKISFDFGKERVRLVRDRGVWLYEPIM